MPFRQKSLRPKKWGRGVFFEIMDKLNFENKNLQALSLKIAYFKSAKNVNFS